MILKIHYKNLGQGRIQLSDVSRYSLVLILNRKRLLGAGQIRCDEPTKLSYNHGKTKRNKIVCTFYGM